jgi:hypothetical protein
VNLRVLREQRRGVDGPAVLGSGARVQPFASCSLVATKHSKPDGEIN